MKTTTIPISAPKDSKPNPSENESTSGYGRLFVKSNHYEVSVAQIINNHEEKISSTKVKTCWEKMTCCFR